jgi:hypothetical protein
MHRKRLEIGVGVSVGLLGLLCMRQREFTRWREPDAVTYFDPLHFFIYVF